MLLPWLAEECLFCWKTTNEEARMFTRDEIDTQFTLEWTESDIVKENGNDFCSCCETATDVPQDSIQGILLYDDFTLIL